MEKEQNRPPSPEPSPVQLSYCIEPLLKFVLESSVNGTLGIAISLSNEFCSCLLKEDAFNPSTDNSEGVPSYPLYKHLASAILHAATPGSLYSTCEEVPLIQEKDCLKQMRDDWNNLVSEKRSELVNMLKSINFEVSVQEPYFSQLRDGLKTIEGRCAVGDYNRIEPGSVILFNKSLMLCVSDVHYYGSFLEMLEAEGLEKVLPGILTVQDGVQIYRKFYTEEKERLNGVLALCVDRPVCQPYTLVAEILCGLGYMGIQSLLGLKQTAGTIPEALPPPKSALLSSFELPYSKPNVRGSCSTVSDGARALAKHVNRSNSKYWGKLEGNDANKNKLAMEVISEIITSCRWLNVHIVPQHGAVFEIRTRDGYGARWSLDGTHFIGFLEPYTVDGHSKKWRH